MGNELLKKSFFALNDIFQDLGYYSIKEAKRAFLALGDLFYENKDFEVFRISAENLNGNMPLTGNNGVGGRPQEIVKMTFECLLRFSMEVKTEKGRIFRTLLPLTTFFRIWVIII
jgi:hypothetical protein